MKVIDDPVVVFGTTDGPQPDRVLTKGIWARMMLPLTSNEAGVPVIVVERRWPRIRVRGYYEGLSGTAAVWISPGYMTMSWFEYVKRWLQERRASIPRAWMVRR